tara:strand:+ start:22722 stop:22988 length:267 start_codon:yes stop_codon:yes gene_type:complete
MPKLLVFALLSFCQLTIAAENDPPVQGADQQEAEQVESDSSIEPQEGGSDLVAAEILDTNEDEEESSVRFIPTEEISQDFGVSFPVDI